MLHDCRLVRHGNHAASKAWQSEELHGILDNLPLPSRFVHQSIAVTGHVGTYDLFYTNPVDVLRELLADPTFEDDMTWAATKCFDSDGKRIWTEMTSGDWMWEMQVSPRTFAVFA